MTYVSPEQMQDKPMTGTRREARKAVLQALYEIDAVGHQPEAVLSTTLTDRDLGEDNRTFVSDLVYGVLKNKEKIDTQIHAFAPAWPIAQIPVVDRNILRLAIFEILLDNKVPIKVAINEAVELAKAFGSDNSARFINGVLGRIADAVSTEGRQE
jgi:N utilization substance protein B